MIEVNLTRAIDPYRSFQDFRHHGNDPGTDLTGSSFKIDFASNGSVRSLRVEWTATPTASVFATADHDLSALHRLMSSDATDPYPPLLDRIRIDEPLSRWLRLDRQLIMPSSGDVWRELVPSILGQRITSVEAARQWHRLNGATGNDPSPENILKLSFADFHRIGVEENRASTIKRCARRQDLLRRLNNAPVEDAYSSLVAIPGVGAWTLAETLRRSHGWQDAVSVGDFHLRNVVTYALTGNRSGTDEVMLKLLEPFRPFRAVVIAAIRHHSPSAERRQPGLANPDIRRF